MSLSIMKIGDPRCVNFDITIVIREQDSEFRDWKII